MRAPTTTTPPTPKKQFPISNSLFAAYYVMLLFAAQHSGDANSSLPKEQITPSRLLEYIEQKESEGLGNREPYDHPDNAYLINSLEVEDEVRLIIESLGNIESASNNVLLERIYASNKISPDNAKLLLHEIINRKPKYRNEAELALSRLSPDEGLMLISKKIQSSNIVESQAGFEQLQKLGSDKAISLLGELLYDDTIIGGGVTVKEWIVEQKKLRESLRSQLDESEHMWAGVGPPPPSKALMASITLGKVIDNAPTSTIPEMYTDKDIQAWRQWWLSNKFNYVQSSDVKENTVSVVVNSDGKLKDVDMIDAHENSSSNKEIEYIFLVILLVLISGFSIILYRHKKKQ